MASAGMLPERRGFYGAPIKAYVEAKNRLLNATAAAAPVYVEQTFLGHGYDPLVSLAVISVTTTDLGLRALCDKEVAKYFYSPRKSMDMPSEGESDIEVKVDLVNGILEAIKKNGQPRAEATPSAPPVNDDGEKA